MEHNDPADQRTQEKADKESSILNLKTLLILGGGFVFLLVFIFGFVTLLFNLVVDRSPIAEPQSSPTGPNLQVNEALDLQQLQATQIANLEGYAWVDQGNERIRIPIDRAMDIIAQQGSAVFPEVGELPDDSGFEEPAGTPSPEEAPARGEAVFQEYGCAGCHTAQDTTLAPTLNGLYGTTEELADGSQVTVDEAYLHDSILNPNAQVVAGYQPIMPSFDGRLNDQQLSDLIEYIKSLGSQ